ncbi:hypothetical protein CWC46_15615 [Prodigiosinella confusarubida]|uniref:Uncharacterized protein n=1 Tax=Serratia sp. (strain ATCC 39006) TaxID=104623 RepID=A0A2I5T969_SERS3|nr:hypothetical protein CWC46_15615 [Serratia sp. ATCC 39006]AUH05440.1 hypothetical protein Ser39006_015620 [Serratia sp. ATCC 39006]
MPDNFSTSFTLQEGGKRKDPDELTQVSDSGIIERRQRTCNLKYDEYRLNEPQEINPFNRYRHLPHQL